MNRLIRMSTAFLATALLCPATASAYQNQLTPLALHLAVSATGLAVAMVLLFEALGLRRVALGGAIAAKLHFVILAIVCLAASALAKWASNFATGITFEQTELGSELLVIVAMSLFAGYFFSVRTAMQSYLKVMRGEQAAQAASGSKNETAATDATAEQDNESEAEPRG